MHGTHLDVTTANHIAAAERSQDRNSDLGFRTRETLGSFILSSSLDSRDSGPALFVAEGFDRIEARGFERGVHPEENADRGREAQADGERPPRQRDGEAGDQVDSPANGAAENDAKDAA